MYSISIFHLPVQDFEVFLPFPDKIAPLLFLLHTHYNISIYKRPPVLKFCWRIENIIHSKPAFTDTVKVYFLHVILILPNPEWNLQVVIVCQLVCSGCAHGILIIWNIFVVLQLPLNQSKHFFFILLAGIKYIQKSLK
jgi:hypothetical protein